ISRRRSVGSISSTRLPEFTIDKLRDTRRFCDASRSRSTICRLLYACPTRHPPWSRPGRVLVASWSRPGRVLVASWSRPGRVLVASRRRSSRGCSLQNGSLLRRRRRRRQRAAPVDAQVAWIAAVGRGRAPLVSLRAAHGRRLAADEAAAGSLLAEPAAAHGAGSARGPVCLARADRPVPAHVAREQLLAGEIECRVTRVLPGRRGRVDRGDPELLRERLRPRLALVGERIA